MGRVESGLGVRPLAVAGGVVGEAGKVEWAGLHAQNTPPTSVQRFPSRIEAQLEELAEAESIDNGKPFKLAKMVDIPRASSNFRFFLLFEKIG